MKTGSILGRSNPVDIGNLRLYTYEQSDQLFCEGGAFSF